MVKIMIYVNPSNPSMGRKWAEVEGREVKFSGFDGYKFILHKSIKSLYDWHVSEATTGFYFAQGDTPNEAMHNARLKLDEKGIKGIKAGLANALKTFETIPLIEDNNASH